MVCNVQSVKKLRSTNIATRMSTNDGPEADNSILEAIHSQETCPSFSYEPEDHMSEDSRSEVMQTVDLLLDVLDDEAGGKVAQPVNVENAETIVQTLARKMEDLTNALLLVDSARRRCKMKSRLIILHKALPNQVDSEAQRRPRRFQGIK